MAGPASPTLGPWPPARHIAGFEEHKRHTQHLAPSAPRRTHLILQVDVTGPAVELLLQAGHHCVVARHSVNARGLQPPCLHNAAARGHDQGDPLGTQAGQAC